MKIAMIGAMVLAASVTTAASQTVWNMPTPVGDSMLVTRLDRGFAEEIEKRTNGALRIKVHSNSSLYKMPEILHAVRSGQVQIGEIFFSSYSNENPVYALESLPLPASGVEDFKKLLDLQKPVLDEIFAKQGIKLAYSVPLPGMGFYTKTEINSVDDLKGMKIRISSPIVGDLVKELGGEPVVTDPSEISQAFMTGMASAMITGSPAVSVKPWEFSKYFYPTNTTHTKSAVIMNQAAFDQLPEDIQKVVLEVAAETQARGWTMMVEDDQANLKIMGEHGMTVMTPSEDFMKGLWAGGDRVIEKWKAGGGEQANGIIDALQKSAR